MIKLVLLFVLTKKSFFGDYSFNIFWSCLLSLDIDMLIKNVRNQVKIILRLYRINDTLQQKIIRGFRKFCPGFFCLTDYACLFVCWSAIFGLTFDLLASPALLTFYRVCTCMLHVKRGRVYVRIKRFYRACVCYVLRVCYTWNVRVWSIVCVYIFYIMYVF